MGIPPQKSTTALHLTVPFFGAGGQAHVPLFTLPVTLSPGGIILAIGRYVLSNRPDPNTNYRGFPHPYYEAGGLLLTTQDPMQINGGDITPAWSYGPFLDEPSGDDGFLGGGTDVSPMHPYTTGIRTAIYQSPAAFQGWLTLMAWCSSSPYAQPGDALNHIAIQGSLSILHF